MIFSDNRTDLRRMYVDAWRKAGAEAPLTALEAQIVAVIRDHPEYQPLMTEAGVDASFTPEGGQTNPFLHMGLHLAVRDQVATDKPPGITNIFNRLRVKLDSGHDAEHALLECLGETLWEAQRQNSAPDVTAYLARAMRL